MELSQSNAYRLAIQTRRQIDVLERLLQVTRYRGFELQAFSVQPLADMTSFLITLDVCSSKPISLLSNQLQKLYDVQQLELCASPSLRKVAGQ